MEKNTGNSVGIAAVLVGIVIIIVIYLTYEMTICPDTNPIGDDTEHIWIGGNGDTIIE